MENIKIELSEDEINKVLIVLSERPLKEVIDVFTKIREQALSHKEDKGTF